MRKNILKFSFFNLIPIILVVCVYVLRKYVQLYKYDAGLYLIIQLGVYYIIPVFLSILNYHILSKKIVSYILGTILVFGILFLCLIILNCDIILYAISDKINYIDEMTIGLTKLFSAGSIFLMIISWIVTCIVRFLKLK